LSKTAAHLHRPLFSRMPDHDAARSLRSGDRRNRARVSRASADDLRSVSSARRADCDAAPTRSPA
jgi:hypothetical protein